MLVNPHDVNQPSRCIKASFYIIENIGLFDFLTTEGFRRQISIKLFYEYMVIFFNLSPTSSHLHPLRVENCGSNSRLVVDEGDNGKFRTERVNPYNAELFLFKPWRLMGFFNLKSSQMPWLALSGSFEYLCYGSTTIINILTLSVRGSPLYVRIVRFWRIKTVPALKGLIA